MPPKRRKMSSVAEDPVYEVEAIIGHLSFEEAHQRELNGILKPKLTLSMKEKSAKKHSKYVFLTRWLGWGEAGDTWEPESNLTTCKTILKEYKKNNNLPKTHQRFIQSFTWSETRPQIPRNKVENVIDVISFENWTYVERSHFCSIYDATWVLTGSNQPVNVTVAVYPDDKQTKSMIIALRLIKHNLIVRCFGRTVLNGKIGVVFEMPEKRPSLYSSEPRRFFESVNGEESVKRMTKDVLCALRHIHEVGIHHRVRPDNIFILNNRYVLGGLELFTPGPTCSLKHIIGPVEYSARDFYNESHDCKVDVFALGIILVKLLNHDEFAGRNQNNLLENLTPIQSSFVGGLVHPDPVMRFTAKGAIEHPYLECLKSDLNEPSSQWMTTRGDVLKSGRLEEIIVVYEKDDTVRSFLERYRKIQAVDNDSMLIALSTKKDADHHIFMDLDRKFGEYLSSDRTVFLQIMHNNELEPTPSHFISSFDSLHLTFVKVNGWRHFRRFVRTDNDVDVDELARLAAKDSPMETENGFPVLISSLKATCFEFPSNIHISYMELFIGQQDPDKIPSR